MIRSRQLRRAGVVFLIATAWAVVVGMATHGTSLLAPSGSTIDLRSEPSTTESLIPTTEAPAVAPSSDASARVVETAPGTPWSNLGAIGNLGDPARVPTRLRIDATGVDAAVSSVDVDADGALQLPDDNTTVAWYLGGSAPGAAGSAVLAAHVDHNGRTGVFFSLRTLAPGAEVRVTSADGIERRFVVDAAPIEIRKTALPTEWIFRRSGPSTITLVTCGGRFDRGAHSYEDNTIVTARLASAG